MKHDGKPVIILMADDDGDDCMLIHAAFIENRTPADLYFVEDGEALMDFLHRCGKYGDTNLAPRPDMILLDLNMPLKDGREALREIKADPELKHIPIVVLTTSQEKEDIDSSYRLGANSFVTKPMTFEQLVDLVGLLSKYWFEVVELPCNRARSE